MYADRYQSRPVDKRSLTLSTAIVGGLLAAAALSPTVIEHVTHDPGAITIYPVAPPPPPPPPQPEPRVQPRPRQATQVAPPDRIVPTETHDNIHVAPADPGPPVDLTGGTGSGGAVIIDPPKPPPVLTSATPDARVDFQPVYPAEERRAGREGVVIVRVLIGVDGRVRDVQQVAAPSDAFWRATEQRARSAWRFHPATRDGVPYEVWRTMTVRFRMETEMIAA